MKRNLVIALLLMSSLTNAQVTVGWFNYPGAVSVATDASDNIYTANWEYNPGGDITLTRWNTAGSIVWNATYDNTDNTRHEVATWVETDNQGNIIVSGTIRSGYSNPVNAASILMKYNSSGNLLWRVVYESTFDGSSTKKCLVDANNNIYVLGIGAGPNGQVTKVKKFNASGVSQWNYFDSGIGGPVNFKFTPDNAIVIIHRGITGSINGFSKIDLNGNRIWSVAGINSLSVGDAAGDAFGNTYIINGEYVVSNAGSIIKKLSASGVVIWSKTNTMSGNRIEVGTDNNPVISGYPNSGSSGSAFMKFDVNGNVLWQNLDADGTGFNLLAHAQLKLDANNAAYLAGGTMSQMAVCKVNSDGTAAWTIATSSGYPACFDFGSDNSVYVTGGTTARITQSGLISVPAVPSNLAATAAGTSQINISWIDNSSNETGFELQSSLSATTGYTTIRSLATNSTGYSNTGLSSSTTYYYRIRAVNAAGSSAWSNIANATTASSTPPASPTNLVAAVSGCNSIRLNWIDRSANETGFEIRRSNTIYGTYTTIATLPANTITYTNTNLKTGQRYYYIVRAINSVGNSAWSNKANARTTCQIVSKNREYSNSSEYVKNVRLFPNPSTSGDFNLNLPAETVFPAILKMYTSNGQLVLQKELNDYNNFISTKGLGNGMYMISLSIDGEIQQMKLQIKK